MLLLSIIGPDTAFIMNKRTIISVSMMGKKNKHKSKILSKKEGKTCCPVNLCQWQNLNVSNVSVLNFRVKNL